MLSTSFANSFSASHVDLSIRRCRERKASTRACGGGTDLYVNPSSITSELVSDLRGSQRCVITLNHRAYAFRLFLADNWLIALSIFHYRRFRDVSLLGRTARKHCRENFETVRFVARRKQQKQIENRKLSRLSNNDSKNKCRGKKKTEKKKKKDKLISESSGRSLDFVKLNDLLSWICLKLFSVEGTSEVSGLELFKRKKAFLNFEGLFDGHFHGIEPLSGAIWHF